MKFAHSVLSSKGLVDAKRSLDAPAEPGAAEAELEEAAV